MRPNRQRSGIVHHRSSRASGEDNVFDFACSAFPEARSFDEGYDRGDYQKQEAGAGKAAWQDRARWIEEQIFPHEADLRRWLQRKLPCPTLVDDVMQDV